MLILLKYLALAATDDAGILLAPVLGRWAIMLAILLFPYARIEGLGRSLKDNAGWREAALATLTGSAACWLVGGWLGFFALAVAFAAAWLAGPLHVDALARADRRRLRRDLRDRRASGSSGVRREGPGMILAKSKEVVVHGGPDLAELARLGVEPAALLDFSVCTNPFGPPPGVRAALAAVAIDQYPDRDAHALRTALAEKYAISPRRILAGNGVSELIWLTALALLRPTDRVLVIGPTYGEYARSVRLREADGPCMERAGAGWLRGRSGRDPGASSSNAGRAWCSCAIRTIRPAAVIEPEWIVRLARENAQTLFVVDEAYQAFVPGLGSLMTVEQENILLVLRSLTKDYALAGLRIGYMVGSSDIIDAVARFGRHGASTASRWRRRARPLAMTPIWPTRSGNSALRRPS